MTKSEYMEALQNKLECFNRELQQEIMEDYEQHFAEGIAAGKSEEEIMAELGSIEDMISELPEEDIVRESAEAESGERTENAMPEAGRQSNTYAGEYRAVVIDGEIADVRLKQSDDGQVHADFDSSDPDYCYYQYEESGTLYLGVKRDQNSTRAAKRAVKFMLFGKTVKVDLDGSFENFEKGFRSVWNGSGGSNIKLEVRIPAGIGRVEIKTRNGDIEVQDVMPEELDLKSSSGDVSICHVTVDRLQLNTTSGDVTAENISSGSMDVHVTSGDVSLDDAESGSIRFQGASGDLSGNRVRGHVVSIRSGSGDVELNGAFESYNIGTGSGDMDIRVKAGAKEVQISTGSGDVELDVTDVERTEVTVGTGSGEAVIYGSGGARHHVTKGSSSVGSGECKVLVTTGSGDAEIRRRG